MNCKLSTLSLPMENLIRYMSKAIVALTRSLFHTNLTSTLEVLEPSLEPSNLSPGLSVDEGVEGRLDSSIDFLLSSAFFSSSCFLFASSLFLAASCAASFFFASIPVTSRQ